MEFDVPLAPPYGLQFNRTLMVTSVHPRQSAGIWNRQANLKLDRPPQITPGDVLIGVIDTNSRSNSTIVSTRGWTVPGLQAHLLQKKHLTKALVFRFFRAGDKNEQHVQEQRAVCPFVAEGRPCPRQFNQLHRLEYDHQDGYNQLRSPPRSPASPSMIHPQHTPQRFPSHNKSPQRQATDSQYPFQAVAVKSFEATLATHLPLTRGQRFTVLSSKFAGWFDIVDVHGRHGGVPAHVVQPIEDLYVGLPHAHGDYRNQHQDRQWSGGPKEIHGAIPETYPPPRIMDLTHARSQGALPSMPEPERSQRLPPPLSETRSDSWSGPDRAASFVSQPGASEYYNRTRGDSFGRQRLAPMPESYGMNGMEEDDYYDKDGADDYYDAPPAHHHRNGSHYRSGSQSGRDGADDYYDRPPAHHHRNGSHHRSGSQSDRSGVYFDDQPSHQRQTSNGSGSDYYLTDRNSERTMETERVRERYEPVQFPQHNDAQADRRNGSEPRALNNSDGKHGGHYEDRYGPAVSQQQKLLVEERRRLSQQREMISAQKGIGKRSSDKPDDRDDASSNSFQERSNGLGPMNLTVDIDDDDQPSRYVMPSPRAGQAPPKEKVIPTEKRQKYVNAYIRSEPAQVVSRSPTHRNAQQSIVDRVNQQRLTEKVSPQPAPKTLAEVQGQYKSTEPVNGIGVASTAVESSPYGAAPPIVKEGSAESSAQPSALGRDYSSLPPLIRKGTKESANWSREALETTPQKTLSAPTTDQALRSMTPPGQASDKIWLDQAHQRAEREKLLRLDRSLDEEEEQDLQMESSRRQSDAENINSTSPLAARALGHDAVFNKETKKKAVNTKEIKVAQDAEQKLRALIAVTKKLTPRGGPSSPQDFGASSGSRPVAPANPSSGSASTMACPTCGRPKGARFAFCLGCGYDFRKQ